MSEKLSNDHDGNGFSDVVGNYLKEKAESFEDMLDAYDSGMSDSIRVGDKIRGEIISVGHDTVFVSTGSKIDGAVEKQELLDEFGELPCKPGDVLELYVVSQDENEIRLSRAISGIGGLNMLQDAFESSVPVEGKVSGTCKGGFHVEILKRRAFCPISQIDSKYVEAPDDYVGQTFEFLIKRIEENGKNIVVSRRDLIEREQKAAREEYMKTLEVGAVLDARIANIMPYGAFAELCPGVEGMIHISEMSWSRAEHPDEIVRADETVRVKVIGMEETEKPGVTKISLSMKQVTGDPWEQDDIGFKAGQKARGRVTLCAAFGAFVELVPGIEGLVHISEMSYKKRVLKPEDIVQPGDAVDVLVKDVDRERRRISLSIRDAEGDPWIGVQKKYPVGTAVEGHVEKREKFGIFVTLEPGVTGLLPKSKIGESANPKAIEKLGEGDAVTVMVASVNPGERKISLEAGDSAKSDDWKKYSSPKSGTQASSLGSLGEKLQQALNSKAGK